MFTFGATCLRAGQSILRTLLPAKNSYEPLCRVRNYGHHSAPPRQYWLHEKISATPRDIIPDRRRFDIVENPFSPPPHPNIDAIREQVRVPLILATKSWTLRSVPLVLCAYTPVAPTVFPKFHFMKSVVFSPSWKLTLRQNGEGKGGSHLTNHTSLFFFAESHH